MVDVFKGMRADRPYPATGLTSARWVNEVPVEWVDVDQLWLTQRHLSIEALLSPWTPTYCRDPLPHVVQHGEDLYLEDGHHRVIRAALGGDQKILARVFKILFTPHHSCDMINR